ncbi:MAG: hypothetical protein CFH22_00050 [Alphaproteobacteria bacterium MarineAlpha5_Bin12]|nr:MAG: hypothetical protein CFH22_00050 [Alphaproteobacteria bacterium MarineAlpha5_Bin12]|tara:strand:+ start:5845 stop:6051 length:207 start_codon:yes stop_codon:yes gene_type:complete
MDEDHLNIEIRRFLKKVGISSQRIIENEIYQAEKSKKIQMGDEIKLEMELKIVNTNSINKISGNIIIK